MNLVENLADKLSSIGVRTAYGEPLDLDGRTIIPVAAVWSGFGGGGGSGQDSMEGYGGGGGSMVWPLGVYVKDTESSSVVFRPNTISVIVAATPAILVAGAVLRSIAKTLRRG